MDGSESNTERPGGLTAMTAAMSVMNLTGLLFAPEWKLPAAVTTATLIVLIGGGYVALWYFWKGRNWARWLVLITSAVALCNLVLLPLAPLESGVILIEAALGGFLLYWLNTRHVRAFFVRERQREPATTPRSSGVGGWLALLIAGLMVVGPLLGAALILADHTSAERETPLVLGTPAWSSFKTATWAGFLAFSAVSIYAGWSLLKERNWPVVRRAIAALWITGPLEEAVLIILVPALTYGTLETFDITRFIRASAWPLVRSTIVAGVGTFYLLRSRRVRSTYVAL